MEVNLPLFNFQLITINDKEPQLSPTHPFQVSNVFLEHTVNDFETGDGVVKITSRICFPGKNISSDPLIVNQFILFEHATGFQLTPSSEITPLIVAELAHSHNGRAAFEIVKRTAELGQAYGTTIPSLAKIILWVEEKWSTAIRN